MFTVTPIGITKEETSFFIFNSSSAVFSVKGIVAALLDEKKAKISVFFILLKKKYGEIPPKYLRTPP